MQKLKNLRRNIESIETLHRHTLIAFISSILITITGYIATFYFTHTLPESDLGEYFLFLSYFNIIVLFMCSGLGGGFTKRVSEGKEKNEYFSAYVFLTLITAVIIIIFLFLARPFISFLNEDLFFDLLILALMVYLVNTVVTNGVVALDKIGIHQTSRFIADISKLAVQIIAVFAGYKAGGLIFGFIIAIIVTLLLNIKYFEFKFTKFNFLHVKSIIAFSVWVLLSTGTVILYSNIDTILLGQYLDPANVAIYRITLQLAALASFIGITFQTVLFPKISRWDAEKNIKSIENALSKILMLSMIFAIPLFLGSLILGDPLLYYLYGAQYTRGYSVLLILIIAQITNTFMFIHITAINSMNKPRLTFITTLLGSASCIGLNIILIPIYGINGAAAALMISSTLSVIISYSILRFRLNIRYRIKNILPIFGAAALMSVILIFVLHFIEIDSIFILAALVIAGALTYFISLVKLNNELYIEILSVIKQIQGKK